MKIETIGRNLPVDDRLRATVEKKLQKLVKLIDEPVEARVTLSLEKHLHVAEFHVTHRLGVLQATEESDVNLLDAVNLGVDKVVGQARKSHQKQVEKQVGKRRGDKRGDTDGSRWPIDVLDQGSVRGGGAPRIIESTHMPIKPMTIEEAALRLEDAEDGFVVFRDAASSRVNVLYRRKDQNYGLIVPE
ncbi:MAG TPA: ribosome-associated translation inhibitor RaiA [Thermoanaerobaculia bacterium]|jgi:putative sigma-54 modulation protein|nr:ribosome-associated translation inhibitor RaiA [Thermoanaerobaculia bacterium]